MKLHILTLGTNADGGLELFGLVDWPSSQSLWHRWQTTDGHWSPWTLFGGYDLHRAVVGRNDDGRLEVIALGADKVLYHKWQVAPNRGWSAWTSLGGSPAKEIAVASNADGRLEAFALDASTGRVKHCWQGAPNGTGALGIPSPAPNLIQQPDCGPKRRRSH